MFFLKFLLLDNFIHIFIKFYTFTPNYSVSFALPPHLKPFFIPWTPFNYPLCLSLYVCMYICMSTCTYMCLCVYFSLSLIRVECVSISRNLFTGSWTIFSWLYHWRKQHPFSQPQLTVNQESLGRGGCSWALVPFMMKCLWPQSCISHLFTHLLVLCVIAVGWRAPCHVQKTQLGPSTLWSVFLCTLIICDSSF